MRGFFSEDSQFGPALSDALYDIYGKEYPRAQYNLEDVISYLDFSQAHLEAASADRRLALSYLQARYELDDYIRERLRYVETSKVYAEIAEAASQVSEDYYQDVLNGNPCQDFSNMELMPDKLHTALFYHFVSPSPTKPAIAHNTLLTLNYDLVAEASLELLRSLLLHDQRSERDVQHLCRLAALDTLIPFPGAWGAADDPIFYGFGARSGWFLKLHGSLDWRYCPNPMCPDHLNRLYTRRRVAVDMCAICGCDLLTAIVPPTFSKDYTHMPTLAVQWRLALRELDKAEQVIIVGLSGAPSDARLAWLFRHGLRGNPRNIDVVCHRDSDQESGVDTIQRFKEILPQHRIEGFSDGFESYLHQRGFLPIKAVHPKLSK